jgi:hypothetical protein
MKRIVFALAICSLLASCGKENTLTTQVEPDPGEFYVKATVNGEIINVANDIDGYRMAGNAGFGTNGFTSVGTKLSKYDSLKEQTVRLFAGIELVRDITSMAGRKIPFSVLSVNNTMVNPKGLVLHCDWKDDNFSSWMAGSNFDVSKYYAEITTVTPYTKGVYGSTPNLEYFKVGLRFKCVVLTHAGETDITNGEAVILVNRTK